MQGKNLVALCQEVIFAVTVMSSQGHYLVVILPLHVIVPSNARNSHNPYLADEESEARDNTHSTYIHKNNQWSQNNRTTT